MQRSSKTELGRTMTEMVSVVVVISLIMVATLSVLKAIRERAAVAELQRAVATRIVQRIHDLQGPLANSARPITEKGPYGYPIHIETGTVGARADYYWVTIGAFQDTNDRTLSYSLCQRFIDTLNLPVKPNYIEVNGSSRSCVNNAAGNVVTLVFAKNKNAQPLISSCSSACANDEVCLDSGCCKSNLVSTTKGVCCEIINAMGLCVYKGHACPNGQIYDDTTQNCIEECPSPLTWKYGHCVCPPSTPLYQSHTCVTCSAAQPVCVAGEVINNDNTCPCDCISPLHEDAGKCLPNNICNNTVCIHLCQGGTCVCPNNTYGDGKTCTNCPENSSSTAGNNHSQSDCTCYPGYTLVHVECLAETAPDVGFDETACNATTGLKWNSETRSCVCDSSNTINGRYFYQNGSCVKCPNSTHVFTGTACYAKEQMCPGEHQTFNGSDYMPSYDGTPNSQNCECEDQYTLVENQCVSCRNVAQNLVENDCKACMKSVWRNGSCRACPGGEHTKKVNLGSTSCNTCEIGYYKNDQDLCTQCPNGYTTINNDTDSYESAAEACTVCSSDTISFNNKQYCCPEGGCCTENAASSCLTCQTNDNCPNGTVCSNGTCQRICRDGMYTYYLGNAITETASTSCGATYGYGDKQIVLSSHTAFNLRITDINAAEVVSIQGSNNGTSWDTLYSNSKTCMDNLIGCPILNQTETNYSSMDAALTNHYYTRYRITALWKDVCQSVSYSTGPLQKTPASNGYFCSTMILPVGN